jgi:DNA-binding CsgD family transcriptional regulator
MAKCPFRDKKYKPYKQITSYLSDIFSLAKREDGYFCVRSGPRSYASQSWMDVSKIANFPIEISRHDYRDAFFSFATYKKSKNPSKSENRITNIFAWSIDVDYKNEAAAPLDVYEYIMENVSLPKPNYIECGHRLRLIYLFKEPLRLFPKNREALLSGYRFLQQTFCDQINDTLGFDGSFGAESCPPTSFFRLPGSVNTKDGSTISIYPISTERFTMQELFSEFVPDRYLDKSGCKEVWYETWKGKPKKKHTINQLWERRMSVFRALRTAPGVHRKKLLFVYGAGCVWTGQASDYETLESALLEFNEGFITPLKPSEISSRYKYLWQKHYKFTDEFLASYLEVEETLFNGLSKKEREKLRYGEKKQKQVKEGKTKSQQMEKRRKKVSVLLKEGKSVAEIARKLKVSSATIKRDISLLRTTKRMVTKAMAKAQQFYKHLARTGETAPFASKNRPHTRTFLFAYCARPAFDLRNRLMGAQDFFSQKGRLYRTRSVPLLE